MSKYFWKFQVLLWFSVCVLVNFSANGFNLSPNPIQVFSEPYLRTYMPKVRSSYFGFSIVLQHDNIIIGAPRAQSSIEAQRNINETGAIYKCNIQSGSCMPFIFDREGNTHIENSEYSYDSEKKDFQWLGGSMDGGPKGTDRLVVCAPRRLADLPNDYLVHGVCFWTSDTRSTSPLYPQKIAPLRLKNKQVLEEKGKNYFYHMFGEQGISVHLTEDNEEIIIGAPGIHTWKGSIIRYKKKAVTDIGGFSRRNSRDTRGKRQAYEYKSEVPNPSLWEQPNDSYFGYAVTSGFFEHPKTNKLFYVATAPQADQQSGEAYIFDVKKSEGDEHKIEIYQKFRGTQFGEYFGYSVLAEDLNGDSMTDLIISAPQYAESLNYEKGAVYTFINKGGLYFERTILIGPSDKPARFGTTLGKLGDINHDGFNDVAISAPFEDDGVVYIYLGGEKGLREKPSQILKPTSMPSTVPSQMFGHGISKGVDIDNNEFNDLAIGAPNSDKVYLFKSYPVVKIVASINPLTRALSINNQTKIQMRACYRIDTTSTKVYQQDLAIKIVADNQIKRVKLSSGSNKMEFTDTATKIDKCRLIDADVRLSLPDIFKPIDIQMSYELLNKFSDQQGFCDGCAAVDPIDAASDSQKIVFSTGCKNEICEADLKLKSSGLQSSSYIIGSSRTISITYEVTNAGETAYLPQINITSSNEMPFAKIPSSCKADNFVLLCNLNEGGPMGTGKKDTLVIVFDTTDIDGESMEIIAEVSSAGNERNNDDNFATNSITLREFSTIEAIGQPISPAINLEKTSGTATIMNHFEIQNTGPSKVKEMEVSLLLPISYMIPNSQNRIPLIDFSNITINATYNNNPIKVDFYQDNIILIQNAVEVSSTPSAIAENVEDPNFSSYNVGNFISQGNGISVDEFSNTQPMARRRRAAEEQAINNEYARIAEKVVELNDDLLGKFPVNRTIIFDCSNTAETICIKAVLKVANFYPGSSHLSIDFKYNIDLGEVDRLLVEPKEFFIVTTALNISKIGDERRDTIQLKKTDPHNIISKHQIYTTPIWVYILAILGGLLLLVVITYGLYKAGFFRRTKKEELEKLTRETYQNAEDTEDEN